MKPACPGACASQGSHPMSCTYTLTKRNPLTATGESPCAAAETQHNQKINALIKNKIHRCQFTVGIVHSMGFVKCIVTCIYNYGVIWTIFTLKIICLPMILFILPFPNHWLPLIFFTVSIKPFLDYHIVEIIQ